MPFEHPIDFPLGDPKERVLRSIRESPVSRFEVNRKLIGTGNVTGESYQISCQYGIAAYAADFRDKAEAVIWDEIMKIIRESDVSELYILNKNQIIEALKEYAEKKGVDICANL